MITKNFCRTVGALAAIAVSVAAGSHIFGAFDRFFS